MPFENKSVSQFLRCFCVIHKRQLNFFTIHSHLQTLYLLFLQWLSERLALPYLSSYFFLASSSFFQACLVRVKCCMTHSFRYSVREVQHSCPGKTKSNIVYGNVGTDLYGGKICSKNSPAAAAFLYCLVFTMNVYPVIKKWCDYFSFKISGFSYSQTAPGHSFFLYAKAFNNQNRLSAISTSTQYLYTILLDSVAVLYNNVSTGIIEQWLETFSIIYSTQIEVLIIFKKPRKIKCTSFMQKLYCVTSSTLLRNA